MGAAGSDVFGVTAKGRLALRLHAVKERNGNGPAQQTPTPPSCQEMIVHRHCFRNPHTAMRASPGGSGGVTLAGATIVDLVGREASQGQLPHHGLRLCPRSLPEMISTKHLRASLSF